MPAGAPATGSGIAERLQAVIGGLALGALVALLGTLSHRQWFPWLLVAAIVVTLAGSVWMASWRRGWAGIGYAAGWLGMVFLLMQTGPGGDVLIAGETVGHIPAMAGLLWVNLGGLAALAGLVTLRFGAGVPPEVVHTDLRDRSYGSDGRE